jgi:hypothetical protein
MRGRKNINPVPCPRLLALFQKRVNGDDALREVARRSEKVQGAPYIYIEYAVGLNPTEGRPPLNDASYLFNHWRDKTNGERMNHWLSVLLQNHELVSQLCTESLRRLQK